jgi:hypothetical protein
MIEFSLDITLQRLLTSSLGGLRSSRSSIALVKPEVDRRERFRFFSAFLQFDHTSHPPRGSARFLGSI